ncbi:MULTISPECIES: RBBP9/YdeN family alpha/beta hydrolase [unclassified Streptomyces]|uniref:RBBP9/YdeN family alpha/beta hydrolase n=1 Tax=unclassified Streptomyces TaxID=2593676 RepID=UPI0002000DE5|nr:alpha/beta hydrolase [Streptomyces sp. SA3_actG]
MSYVVVPGIDGSDEAHWQSRWEAGWGAEAVRIAPGSWSAPDLEDWVAALGKAYEAVAGRGPVVLVAHSLGCWAVAEWLRRARPEDAAAFLVAPPDPHGPAFPAEAAPAFVPLRPAPLPCPALLVASADDPYCPPRKSADLATAWGARLRLVGSRGHLNTASGVGEWGGGEGTAGGVRAAPVRVTRALLHLRAPAVPAPSARRPGRWGRRIAP